jgi:peptidoglycan/LPS O-acetylase OafA/YrhL
VEKPVVPAVDATLRSHVTTIDGIRGFSIAFVLLYHFWPGWVHPVALTIVPRAGWITVDLFFLISGFGIFYPYARALVDGRPEQTLRSFVVRRFAKIYPSYILSLVAIAALGWSMTGYRDIGFQLFAHALFIHSFFDATMLGINGPTWSLALEVQFYALFALTRGLAIRAPLAYASTLIGVGIAYRVALATIAHTHTALSAQQLPSVLDCFGAGMLTAYLYRRVLAWHPQIANRPALWTTLFVVSIAGLYALLFAIERVVDEPEGSHVVAALVRSAEMPLFVGLVWGALFGARFLRAILVNRASLYLAAISYNLFLWHQAIFLALLRVTHARSAHSSVVAGIVALVAVAASLAVAHVLTYYFEQPIRQRLQSVQGRRAPAV